MRLIKSLVLLLCLTAIACGSSKRITDPAYDLDIDQHRKEYKEKFNAEDHSPLKGTALDSMQFYAADLRYRVVASFTKNDAPETVVINTYSGKQKNFYVYGTIDFELLGKPYALDIYRSHRTMQMPQYENYLFLPFKDFTNGDATYGGGRYIDLETTDIKEGKVNIDFNKCYNPYCAYSDGYNCPIPPVENHFEIEIPVGEKKYGGTYRGA